MPRVKRGVNAKKKKKKGQGEQPGDAAPNAAVAEDAEEEEDSAEWQAVGKKGKKQQP